MMMIHYYPQDQAYHILIFQLVSYIGVSVTLNVSFPLCFLLYYIAYRPVKMPAAWQISTGHAVKAQVSQSPYTAV